jgi:ATP/maltotriose-dependent transcriptional regulator MalT
LLAAPQAPPPSAVLTILLNELNADVAPLLLVLDDYHLIETQTIHGALTFLIDHLPATLQLVIISRFDPPLPLARWRVRNQLAEVRADDLRFASAEATAFLNDAMGLTLSAAEITALETRTEGWIAGLHLAALSLQGRGDAAEFIRAFSGSHRHVLSYLVQEVLNHHPADTLNFLFQTSILERMSASLCDAVTGRNDSQQLLEQLEQANLFMIPLDHDRTWYHYHTRPILSLVAAWIYMAARDLDALEHVMNDIPTLQATDLNEELQSQRLILRACLAIFHGEFGQAIAYARDGLALVPATNLGLRAIALFSIGLGLAQTYDWLGAESVLEETIVVGKAGGNIHNTVMAYSWLSKLQIARGDVAQALQTFQDALHTATQPGQPPLPVVGLIYIGLGTIWVDQGRYD